MASVNIGKNIVHLADCIEVLRSMPDNSVDSIVTDPPYGLSFMGRKWDYDVPGTEVWAECLRVLKPGGHLLAFAGTRTQHRMAVRIEDAGFEIRDMIAWVYASGFPKSLDVSKAIDKAAGAEREFTPVGKAVKRLIHGADQNATGSWIKDNGREYQPGVTAPATEAARQWQGWGTALKPALEPITVARKPLDGTVAANVLEHGTGALNIDGCRVALNGDYKCKANGRPSQTGLSDNYNSATANQPDTVGRWPANLIHDGSEEVVAAFPQAGGQKADLSASAPSKKLSTVYAGGPMARTGEASADSDNNGTVGFKMRPGARRLDTGSAARFFYCAKASRADRNEGLPSGDKPAVGTNATMREREDADWSTRNGNHHPTVKPTDLMAYLCRLVTPPGGTVLDPFMGSGSTGKAAIRERFQFVGIEKDPEYIKIAIARIEHAHEASINDARQFSLFEEVA